MSPREDEAAGGVTLTTRSDGCILVASAMSGNEQRDKVSLLLGLPLPTEPGPITAAGERRAIWLSPHSWLVRCLPEDEEHLVNEINGVAPNRQMRAARYGDYLCWFALAGTASERVLHGGGFISLERDGLPVGHAKRTLVAGLPTVVVRTEPSEWSLAVEQSYRRYFESWFSAAARAVSILDGR